MADTEDRVARNFWVVMTLLIVLASVGLAWATVRSGASGIGAERPQVETGTTH